MGRIVQWTVAALLVAQGVGLGGPVMAEAASARPPLAALATLPLAQTDDAPDDEPLDGDVEETPEPRARAEEPAAPVDEEPLDEPTAAPDEETLDQGPAPVAADGDAEPLDQGVPPPATAAPAPSAPATADVAPPPAASAPAPAPEQAPAPAAAPVPAAEPAKPAYHPEPTYYPEPIYQTKPVYSPAPVWPFDDGGVFVNAGFAPDVEFPFSSGFETCDGQVRLGRAYVGTGCDGADVTVGHLPPPGQDRDGAPSVFQAASSPAFSAFPASSPTRVVAPPSTNLGFQPNREPESPRRTAAPTGSRTRDEAENRIVRGESRTTTTTTVVNRDGTDEVSTAQGADNQTSGGDGDGGKDKEKNKNGGKKNKGKNNKQNQQQQEQQVQQQQRAGVEGADGESNDANDGGTFSVSQAADSGDGDGQRDNDGKRDGKGKKNDDRDNRDRKKRGDGGDNRDRNPDRDRKERPAGDS